ncbi:MAG: DUF2959 domain-containing protein [Planctomycetota bacterium]
MIQSLRQTAIIALGVLLLGGVPLGCASARIALAERFGYEKREQLVDSVEEARDEQEEAKEQFATALEAFTAVTGYEGGNLESIYERLDREHRRSESRAKAVRERIDSVERVGNALFTEWERELDQYTNVSLRSASEQQLVETRGRYTELVGAMRRAASKMDPVLAALNDQVLFLKHNLNARAVASLEGNLAVLESDVAQLIAEMEASIAEADAFISELTASG